MKQFFRAIILLGAFIIAMPVYAETLSDPVKMLTDTSDQILSALKQGNELESTMVRKILLPHIDRRAMARAIIGREHWRSAEPSVRQAFIDAMTELVIQTYSTALANYDNQKIIIFPLRESIGKRRSLQVKSVVVYPDDNKLRVNYRVRLHSDKWKVYDFSVEGLSLVKSYRSQFKHTLDTQGVEALTKQINSHVAGVH